MTRDSHLKGQSLVDSSEDPNVKIMALRIGNTVAEHDASCHQMDSSTPARARAMPDFFGQRMKIAASEYVLRIAKYGRCSPSCFTMAMVYLGRIKKNQYGLCLHSKNVQRLLASLIMLAAKFADDQFYANNVWAQVCLNPLFFLWLVASLVLFSVCHALSILAQPILTGKFRRWREYRLRRSTS